MGWEPMQSEYAGPETVHVPGGTGQDGAIPHHATQNGAPSETWELFISEVYQPQSMAGN